MIRKNIFIVLLSTMCCVVSSHASEDSLSIYINKKQFRQAIILGDSLQQNIPLSLHSLYLLGQAYEGLFRYKEAFNLYNKVYAQDSLNEEYLFAKARISNNLGKQNEAEDLYLKVIHRDSSSFFARNQLINIYLQKEKYPLAIQHLTVLLNSDNENYVLWRRMGDIYNTQSLYSKASLFYMTAMNRNKGDWQTAHALINTLLRINDEEANYALTVCDTALSYNPDNIYLRRDKANALYTNKMYEQADSLYSLLLSEGDSCYQTVKYLGASRFRAKQYYKSVEPLELAYTFDSTATEVTILLGAALGKTIDNNRGLTLLQRADSLLRPNPIFTLLSNIYKAEILLKKPARRDEGIRLYYEIYLQDTERIDILLTLTSSYIFGGGYSKENELSRQKALFLASLTIRRMVEKEMNLEDMSGRYQMLLESYVEELFFTNKDKYPTLSPDGKIGNLTRDEINQLIKILKEKRSKETIIHSTKSTNS